MSNKVIIKESVRGIIEYVLKTGSLDDRYMGKSRALEGTLAHQKLQSSNEKIYTQYQKEVRLEQSFDIEDVVLLLEGRADGIIIDTDNVYIEEIKSTMKSLVLIDEDYNDLHWAQGKFYAYMYSLQNQLDEINKIKLFQYRNRRSKKF